MPGRPVGTKFEKYHFKLEIEHEKYFALCLVCNKKLSNSAEGRLKSHRNLCKIINKEDNNIHNKAKRIRKESTSSSNKSSGNEEGIYEDVMECEVSSDGFLVAIADNAKGCSSSQFQSTVATQSQSSENLSSTAAPVLPVNSLAKKSKNKNIKEYIDRLSPEEEQCINNAVARFFFGCNIPLSTVTSIHFKQMIRVLRPAYLDKIPSRKMLSTTLLDRTYEKLIENFSNLMQGESVCLIDGWKNSAANAKTVVCLLHNSDGSKAFLNAWDLTGTSETGEKLAEIISDAIELAKKMYNTRIYATVSDNASAMSKMGMLLSNAIWHSNCNSHTANLLAKDMMDKELTKEVALILKEFKQCDLEKSLVEKGGHKIKLPCETRWCTYRDSYESLLNNLQPMKQIAANDEKKIKQEVKQLIFNDLFINKVKDYVELFDPICRLINTCQKSDCSVADAINLWLQLKLPIKFRKFLNFKLDARKKMASNVYALSAYYLHPFYDNNALNVDDRRTVHKFLLSRLDGSGIEELDVFENKTGIFRILFQKDIKKPLVFWRMAKIETPNLAQLAIRLLQIPASSAQIERAFSNWGYIHTSIRNRLTFERSKKLIHTYYSLKIEESENISFEDYLEDELTEDH